MSTLHFESPQEEKSRTYFSDPDFGKIMAIMYNWTMKMQDRKWGLFFLYPSHRASQPFLKSLQIQN